MVAPFVEAFRAFAVAEGDRDPGLARPMALLAGGLDHVTVAEPTPQTGLPVADRHFEAALAAGVGVPADLARIVAGLGPAVPRLCRPVRYGRPTG